MEILAPKLTSYQEAIINSRARFTITEAATKCGKTFSHNWWLFKEAHTNVPKIGANYWWVAPIYSQSEIAFNRVVQKLKGNSLYDINRSSLKIKTPANSIIQFKSADNPDNLYGEDVYGAVFDEFTRSSPEAWYALRSTLTFTNGKCKLIGNHTGQSNWGHLLKEKCKTDPEYEYFKITAFDAAKEGIISYEEIEQARKDLPHNIFMQLYMAESVKGKDDLVTLEKINDLFTNNFIQKTNYKFISCDIALLNDKSVIVVWDGLVITQIYTFQKINSDELKDKIIEISNTHQVPRSNIIYDGDGIGAYLNAIDGAVKFNNNGKATCPEFINIKSELAYKLADLINKGQIFIDCVLPAKIKEELIEELQCLKSRETENKMGIITKDDMKKIIGRSPDILDAIIYRMLYYIIWNQ